MSETETEIATEFGTADYIIIAVALSVIVAVYFLLTKKKAPAKSNILTPPGTTTTKPQQQKPPQEAVEEKGIPMTILYGSQSGTAETFSYELAKEAKSHGFAATVIDLEKYDHENKLPSEKFVCFLLATFGEGEPTDSSQKFYEWMMSPDRVPGTVEGVEYACFALGNRQYEHFCAVGRRITNKMKEFGATELLDHGEGDDDGSLEDDYAAWKKKFWEVAQKRFGGDSHEVESKFEGSFNITYHEDEKTHGVAPFANSTNEDDDFVLVDTPSRVPAVVMDPKHGGDFAPVTDNYELRQDSTGGSTRHIEIDLSSMPFSYRTADTLGVYPRNNFKLAAKMAKRLGVNTKTAFSLNSKVGDRKLPFPSPCTVHDALLWYCDLTSIPKRGLLETLATYATDAADKAKLMNWIHEGKAQYHEDQKNLVEVMQEVPSVKPPLEHFLEFVPKLVPRLYTISSSSRVSPSRLTITVSVTKADKPRGRVHEGVCSTYLASLVPNKDKVAVFVRASTFRPAWDPVVAHPAEAGRKNSEEAPQRLRKVSISELKEGVPMIMIGPGTGVAPFRGFLQEAEFLRKQGVKLGDLYLYFGCQRSDRDFIYKEEFEGFEKSGVAKVSLAFSREGNQKVYVQHRMAEHAQQIWDLLENKGAHMYLCGGTSMGRDVRNAVIDIAKKYGGRSDADAQKYLATLQDTGRFIQELWS